MKLKIKINNYKKKWNSKKLCNKVQFNQIIKIKFVKLRNNTITIQANIKTRRVKKD